MASSKSKAAAAAAAGESLPDDDLDEDAYEDALDDDRCTPPEFRDSYGKVSMDLLPKKSSVRYHDVLAQFQEWMREKRCVKVSENVLAGYYSSLSETLKATTVTSRFSILRTMLHTNGIFERDNEAWHRIFKACQVKGKGEDVTQASIFSADNIKKYFETVENSTATLVQRVVFAIGMSTGFRKSELYQLKHNDVTVVRDDAGAVQKIVVAVSNRKTDAPDTKENQQRAFVVRHLIHIDVRPFIEQYINLRDNKITLPWFFMQVRNNKMVNQRVGEHSLADVTKEVARFLNLSAPESYTAHSFRRTNATLIANAGASPHQVTTSLGWKDTKTSMRYIAHSEHHAESMSRMLSGTAASPAAAVAPLPLSAASSSVVSSSTSTVSTSSPAFSSFSFGSNNTFGTVNITVVQSPSKKVKVDDAPTA
jgi:site-specific recombinase XerD